MLMGAERAKPVVLSRLVPEMPHRWLYGPMRDGRLAVVRLNNWTLCLQARIAGCEPMSRNTLVQNQEPREDVS